MCHGIFLIDDTIARNVAFGLPGPRDRSARLREALCHGAAARIHRNRLLTALIRSAQEVARMLADPVPVDRACWMSAFAVVGFPWRNSGHDPAANDMLSSLAEGSSHRYFSLEGSLAISIVGKCSFAGTMMAALSSNNLNDIWDIRLRAIRHRPNYSRTNEQLSGFIQLSEGSQPAQHGTAGSRKGQ
jgi:hypothetical protein